MLTTAHLLTDRLDRVSDETVQRVAPRLVATLDRAIAFCEATLAYGRAAERLPHRRLVPLEPLIADLANLTDLAPELGIVFKTDVAGRFVDRCRRGPAFPGAREPCSQFRAGAEPGGYQ